MEKSLVTLHTFPGQLTQLLHLTSILTKNVNSAAQMEKEMREHFFFFFKKEENLFYRI